MLFKYIPKNLTIKCPQKIIDILFQQLEYLLL